MTDLTSIKQQLERRLSRLNRRAVSIDEDLSSPGDDDFAEQAVESAGDEVLEEVGDATAEEIDQIKLALSHIRDGSYGTCTECRRTIAANRLEAQPSATTCVKCA